MADGSTTVLPSAAMFRRALLLLLVVLLPLKVAAAGVVSLVGPPGHVHAAHDGAQPTHGAHAPHATQEAHAGAHMPDDAPTTPHDHTCPHLGMVSIAVAAPIIEPLRAVDVLNAPPAPRFSSVVHDVPSPIPLAFSAR